jgi:hypothetical protein
MTDALGGNAGSGALETLFIAAVVVCLALSLARAWLQGKRP